MSFPTLQELYQMPINKLRHLDIRNGEEEKLVQQVVNARITRNPIVYQDKQTLRVPDIMNGEQEAEWQKKVDEYRAKQAPKPVIFDDVSEDTVLGLTPGVLGAVEKDIAINDPSVPGVQIGNPAVESANDTQTVEAKPGKACCGSLGFRHKSSCPTLVK